MRSNHNRCAQRPLWLRLRASPGPPDQTFNPKEGIAKDADAKFDPSDPLKYFREATWDEALDFAANGLKKVIRETEGSGLQGWIREGSNEEFICSRNLSAPAFRRITWICTRLCHASSVAALIETVNSGAVSALFNDAAKSDVIVVIGANPTVNHPVAATFFKNAVKAGAKPIVMDPRGRALTRHATH